MRINANGIGLEVEDLGPKSAPSIVMIRGLGSQMVHWPNELIKGFAAEGFRVVAFDNRDVGLSDRVPTPGLDYSAEGILEQVRIGQPLVPAYSLEDMARDVIGLMDTLEIERAHIWGISMGGAIAQILAMDHAERLHSATCVMSTTRPIGKRGFDEERLRWLLAYPMTEAEAEDYWVEGHANWGSPGYPMSEAEIREQARRAYRRGHDPEGMNRQFLAGYMARDRQTRLEGVSLPVHVIHGEDDTLVTPALGREVASAIPDARYDEVPGMGHVVTPMLAPTMVHITKRFIDGLNATLAP